MPEGSSPRYVTGAEFGLTGNDQIRIALETILQNNGVATMRKITAAVEKVINERDAQCRLSDQGKASLRFFVNKVAVKAGYIHKHDQRRDGWAITPKGQADIISSPAPHLGSKMLTAVGQNFQLSLSDVYALLYAEKTVAANEAASAAYIRAGVILTVTAWETFIEDTLRAYLSHVLKMAATPNDMSSIFNSVAKAWLDSTADKKHVQPPTLRKWTGDGWKSMIYEYFEKELATFNTPKSDNIAALFQRYADFNICLVWEWERTTSAEACNKLDELVSKRGDLVHRGKTSADTEPLPTRDWLINMITLIEQMAWITDLQIHDRLSPLPAS